MSGRQTAKCPCYLCQGRVEQQLRTIKRHMAKQSSIIDFYFQDTNTAMQSVVLNPPPIPDIHPFPDIQDADDYIEDNPIHELPGWADRITVISQQAQKFYTKTQKKNIQTHYRRTRTVGHLQRLRTRYSTGKHDTKPAMQLPVVYGTSHRIYYRRITPWVTSVHSRRC
jgi:hypothetical protein